MAGPRGGAQLRAAPRPRLLLSPISLRLSSLGSGPLPTVCGCLLLLGINGQCTSPLVPRNSG